MRITGGKDKGRIIKVHKSIRPTEDKIRSIIFDVLGDKINGVRFIDLFAGSGSVGIEALSRGAEEAIFVEKSQKVIQVLKENISSLGYLDRSKIILKDALKLLASSTLPLKDSRTIIFADPPYNKGYIKELMDLLLNSQTLNFVSSFIIEHSKHEPVEFGDHYKSGDSIITFIERR